MIADYLKSTMLRMHLRQARTIPDPLVKMYDIRTMKPLPPVPFPAGPAFINVLPKRSSTIVVTSNQGLINIVDTSNPTNAAEFYQVCTCLAKIVRVVCLLLFSLTQLLSCGLSPYHQQERIWLSETEMVSFIS